LDVDLKPKIKCIIIAGDPVTQCPLKDLLPVLQACEG